MAMFRRFFYRKPPEGLLEISERVFVFDCCFTTDFMEENEYKVYVEGIVDNLREYSPEASFMVFNFREGEKQTQIANILSEYDMTVIDYPRQYESCPLLTMEMIHHFLRSSESWLSLGRRNILLMHCERGGWPVLAFMLAALLIYRKQYNGEQKTLDMIYKQAPIELLQLMLPLNPLPSQVRYLQYVSRRNVGSVWPPLDRALTLDCVILRFIPNMDGEGGCRPIFRIYGQDPFMAADRTPKVLFSTPKRSKTVRYCKQADCELVKIDIHCHVQGDVVLECISLDNDLEREVMMFRVMFNTAFIRSNILMLNRDEIDILWNAKDRFPMEFRAEVLFSEMDAASSRVTIDLPGVEVKGLPIEAFAKVQEMFNNVDWLDPKTDVALSMIQQINILQEKLDYGSPRSIKGFITLPKSSAAEVKGKPVPKVLQKTNMLSEKLESGPGSVLEKPKPGESEDKSMALNKEVAPSSEPPLDVNSQVKEVEAQELQFPLQCLAHSNIITQRIPPTSLSMPTSCGNSLTASPVPISRYQTAPSALGITALLNDHKESGNKEITHQVTISPPRVALDPGLHLSKPPPLPSPPPLIETSSKPPPPPPPPPPRTKTSKSPAPPPSPSPYIKTSSAPPAPPPPPPHSKTSVSSAAFPTPTPFTKTSSVPPAPPPPPPPYTKTSSVPPASPPTPPPYTKTSSVPPAPPPPPPPYTKTSLVPPAPPPPPPPYTQPSSLPPPLSTPPSSSFSNIAPSPDLKKLIPTPPPPPPTSSSGLAPFFHVKDLPPIPPPPPPSLTPPSSRIASSATGSVSLVVALSPPPPPPPICAGPASSPSGTSPAPRPPPPPSLAPKSPLSKNSPHVPSVPPPPALFANGLSRAGTSPQSHSAGNNGTIPPIPGPPFSMKGRLPLRQRSQDQSKRTSLKPYHWLKLTRAMQGSLWAEAQKSDESSKAPEFDMAELESLFAVSVPNSNSGSTGGKSARRGIGNKSDKVTLSSVLALDDSALDIDQVDNLIKFCPTKEEMELLKNYNGNKENLGKCEQFFLELMKVPRIESKLRVFSFKIQFSAQVSDLRHNLGIVNSVSEEIRTSVKLKRIMQTILSLGNALNHGTARGSAVGFRLDSLLKLTDTRARNNKMTLMHYLCKVLAEKLPELLDFPMDLISLEASAKIQLKYLAEEMQAISKGLEKVVQELTASENDGPVSANFCKILKEFLGFAEAEVRSLASLYSGVGRNADALALYFGEDPARIPFEQVVSTLLNFVKMFGRAHEENCKHLELEKKRLQKEEENGKGKTSISQRESQKDKTRMSISIKECTAS